MATKTASKATPRASRSLVLSFGMFRVDIAMAPLFKADGDTIKGHKSCTEHHGPVKQAWFCEHGDHYVAGDEIETAYEYGGRRIVLGAGELSSIEAERDGVVTLRKSCKVADIDPSYFEKSYLVWPQAGPSEEAFAALSAAMRNTDSALVGQVVVSKTDRMLVLRWSAEHGCVIGHICNFAANMKADAVALVADTSVPDPAYVAQAELLIGSLLSDFDPSLVEDTYQARLAVLLHTSGNASGQASALGTAPAAVPSLMESLAAAVAAQGVTA